MKNPCAWEKIGNPEQLRGWITEPTEDEMEQIEQTFMTWLVFEKVGRTSKHFYCTHCGASWYAEKRRRPDAAFLSEESFRFGHLEAIQTPCCGREAIVIAEGRMGASCLRMKEKGQFVILHAEPDGWLSAQAIEAVKDYSGKQWDTPIEIERTHLYLFRPPLALHWKKAWKRENNAWVRHWERCATVYEPFFGNMQDYYTGKDHREYDIIGVEGVLERTDMRYCGIDVWGDWHGHGYLTYLGEYCRRPQLELCAKLGFYDAINRLIGLGGRAQSCSDALNWRAKDMAGFLRLPKAQAKQFMKLPTEWKSIPVLRLIREQYVARGTWDIREIARLAELVGARTAEPVLHSTHGHPLNRITAYLSRCTQTERGLWTDYIQMAKELEYDLSRNDVFFPKNLRERHDDAQRNQYAVKNPELVKNYEKALPYLRRQLDFELDGLCVRVPKDWKEIRDEGVIQRICVGSYAERHLERETTILFLRNADAPDIPMVTMEVAPREPWQIRQIHGYRNDFGVPKEEQPGEKYKAFLNEWKDWLLAGSPRNADGTPRTETERTRITA